MKGEKVVQDGEDGFLDLTGIRRIPDNARLLGEVEHDEGVGGGPIDLW